MSKSRDNIPGFVLDNPLKMLLFPGVAIQWLMYMNPQRGMRGVAYTRRRAQSPLMTYWYSFLFYALIVWLIYQGLLVKIIVLAGAYLFVVIYAFLNPV